MSKWRNYLQQTNPTPDIRIAHTIAYWFNGIPTYPHHIEIFNLQTYIDKYHCEQELQLLKSNFAYDDKCVFNEQINKKLPNHFWNALGISDAQFTQTLKSQYAQYMGNHRKNIFRPQTYPNSNWTFCANHEINTWPHLLSTCTTHT